MYTKDDDGYARGARAEAGRLLMVGGAMKVPSWPLLVATVLIAAGCGREARSADPEGEMRVAALASASDDGDAGRAEDLRGPAIAEANSRSVEEVARRPEMTLRSADPRGAAPARAERDSCSWSLLPTLCARSSISLPSPGLPTSRAPC